MVYCGRGKDVFPWGRRLTIIRQAEQRLCQLSHEKDKSGWEVFNVNMQNKIAMR
jgi:hypothetical protein